MGDMPAAEVVIDVDLVQALLEDQHPDLLVDRPAASVRPLAHGWDNESFRLGDDLVVRLPRRELAADLVRNEQAWLAVAARDVSLQVPVPLRSGAPGRGYPWEWSVLPWIDGDTWEAAPPVDPEVAADVLGSALAALHRPAPADAPRNPYRGIPLGDRRDLLVKALGVPGSPGVPDSPSWLGSPSSLDPIGDLADARRIVQRFDDLAAVDGWGSDPVWLHGDLHPLNIVVNGGEVAGLIDFGDICAGDPATDLAVAWMLFGPGESERFRAAAGAGHPVDADTWARARGWALALGVAYLGSSDDNPAMAAIGRRTITAALDDT